MQKSVDCTSPSPNLIW